MDIEIDGNTTVTLLCPYDQLPRHIKGVIFISNHHLRGLLLAFSLVFGYLAFYMIVPMLTYGFFDLGVLANDPVIRDTWIIGWTGFPVFMTLLIIEHVIVRRMVTDKYPWFARYQS